MKGLPVRRPKVKGLTDIPEPLTDANRARRTFLSERARAIGGCYECSMLYGIFFSVRGGRVCSHNLETERARVKANCIPLTEFLAMLKRGKR